MKKGRLGFVAARKRRLQLTSMLLDDALDRVARDVQTPQAKLLAALELYDEGVALQRLTFQRRFPELRQEEIELKLNGWLAREDEAL